MTGSVDDFCLWVHVAVEDMRRFLATVPPLHMHGELFHLIHLSLWSSFGGQAQFIVYA